MSVLLRGGTQFQFGSYLLDAANRSLLCDGQPVVITSKTFDLPLLLVTYRDRLVTKAEIRAALWGEVHVEEANIHQQISTLRRDSLIRHEFHETAVVRVRVRGRLAYTACAPSVSEILKAPPFTGLNECTWQVIPFGTFQTATVSASISAR